MKKNRFLSFLYTDTAQKSYALIARDGTLTFKNMVKTPISGTWVEEAAEVEILDA